MSRYDGKKVLFQLTGSIACYKACMVVSRLVQEGCQVKTICSSNALHFIGKSTLEGLTHSPVHVHMFEEKSDVSAGAAPKAHGPRAAALEHVEIVKWLDLAIVCPATANMINKLAAGIGDDYISTTFLAFDFSKPYLIAPAMNRRMYAHPATVRSMRVLKEWGVKVLGAGSGYQACGEQGDGRLLEPDELFREITGSLSRK